MSFVTAPLFFIHSPIQSWFLSAGSGGCGRAYTAGLGGVLLALMPQIIATTPAIAPIETRQTSHTLEDFAGGRAGSGLDGVLAFLPDGAATDLPSLFLTMTIFFTLSPSRFFEQIFVPVLSIAPQFFSVHK
ncbi:MAG: hypothetical protein O3B24_09335 [Verrucomicrobia bacterium]|nr:hypothetical protein [Verrucomicrobiota bacterium]